MQSVSTPAAARGASRFASLIVFLIGTGVTAMFYSVVSLPAFRESQVYRYFLGHPIEVWTTWLFFWGMAALAWKLCRLLGERTAVRQTVLAIPAGRRISSSEIPNLLQDLTALRGRQRNSWFVRRIVHALEYVQYRGSAEGLEDRMELLADRDANELDGSYELVRTVTWAIPILGFLGTVIGITIAIANITPDQLQDSLSEVVGGLAVAFDTTALALALSMLIVLSKFFVERMERAVLMQVDTAAEDTLLHRFEHHGPEAQQMLGMVDGVARIVLQATRDAWREQGQLWSRAVEQVGENQVSALENAVRQFLEQSARVAATQETQFQQFLSGLESLRQLAQKSMADVAGKMTAHQAAVKRQVELLSQLVADEGRVTRLQQVLNDNLATLANAQALDEAIHSLTAAVHLLTARANRAPNDPRPYRPAESDQEEAA